jgi:hypothetical protein
MKSFNDFFKAKEPRADPKPKTSDGIIKGNFAIKKSNDEKMQAFGWASVSIAEDGKQIDDWQDDMIDPEDLESAAYDFVKFFRDAGEMHQRNGVGMLIESMVFTKEKLQALGIPDASIPVGWWVGFQVTNPDVWAKVKDGTYRMFSIEGTAVREKVEEDPDDDPSVNPPDGTSS